MSALRSPVRPFPTYRPCPGWPRMGAVPVAHRDRLSHEEWLELRSTGIGGSDAAAAVGLSRWKSPAALYLEKLGLAVPTEPGEAAYWGRVLEDVLADEFSRRHPEAQVRRVRAVLRGAGALDFMLADLDRVVRIGTGWDREYAILECKTTSARRRGEWDEGVPDEYHLQVQHYLAVTGYDVAYLAVLIGGQEYREIRIERNDALISRLVELEASFWERVQRRDPPPVDGSEASSELLDRLYPEVQARSRVALPLEARAWIEQYREAATVEREAARRREEAANRIKALLGEAEVGLIAGEPVVSWKQVTRRSIDAKALRAELPEVADRFTVQSTYRTFRLLEGDE